MKTLAILLLIAANSLVAAQTPPTDLPTDLPTRTYSGGLDSSCNRYGQGPVIKHSPGTIMTIHASGSNLSSSWLLLFNKTTPPLQGDVPAIAIPFAQVNQSSIIVSADRDYPGGLPMTSGISWALSASPNRLAGTDCHSMTLTVTYQ